MRLGLRPLHKDRDTLIKVLRVENSTVLYRDQNLQIKRVKEGKLWRCGVNYLLYIQIGGKV